MSQQTVGLGGRGRAAAYFPTRNRPGLRPVLVLAGIVLAVMLAVMPGERASAGAIRDFPFASKALGKEGFARVYVPDGASPAGGWPVLYLLHGLDGSASDWQELGDIQPTLDGLISAGRLRPILVVMPAAGNSWYVDSGEVGGPGNYQTMMLEDLPAAVETAFAVGRDASHRAVAGLSMGGAGALRLAFARPDRYGAVAALSPAIWQNVPAEEIGKAPGDLVLLRETLYFHRYDPDTVGIGIDIPPEGIHFGGAFGTPFDPARFNAQNVFTLLGRPIADKTPLPPTFITVGDDDSHLLWRGAIALFETLRASARPVELRMTDGDHTWDLWRVSITDALLFVEAALPKG